MSNSKLLVTLRGHGMFRQFAYLLLAILALSVNRVAASTGMDFGDASALIIGLFIGIIGILACLGQYARRQRANQF